MVNELNINYKRKNTTLVATVKKNMYNSTTLIPTV